MQPVRRADSQAERKSIGSASVRSLGSAGYGLLKAGPVKLLANLEREVIQVVEEHNDLPDFAVRHGRLILFRAGVGAGLHVAASLPFVDMAHLILPAYLRN